MMISPSLRSVGSALLKPCRLLWCSLLAGNLFVFVPLREISRENEQHSPTSSIEFAISQHKTSQIQHPRWIH